MSYILFFDSGIGGLSVLIEAIKLHPDKNYIFFADEKNLPYGDKSADEVRDFTLDAVSKIRRDYDISSVAISCNTATSAAITPLRNANPDIPIVGIEPAVKPACERANGGRVGVMATAGTLAGKKFKTLAEKYGKGTSVVPIPAPGLVELIERFGGEGVETEEFLNSLFDKYGRDFDVLVLGCTHYPFAKEAIKKASGCTSVIDGSLGTVKQLFRLLAQRQADNFDGGENGEIIFLTSCEKQSENGEDFPEKALRFLKKDKKVYNILRDKDKERGKK